MNIFESSRTIKRLITVSVDALIILVAFWGAILLRLETFELFLYPNYWLTVLTVIPFSIMAFIKLGLYRAVLRYVSTSVFWSVTAASATASAVLVVSNFFFSTNLPKTVPVIFFALAITLIGSSRLLVRAFVSGFNKETKRPVIIYGAGSAGRQLAVGLNNGPEYRPVAFIDDDTQKQGAIIQGIPVMSLEELDEFLKGRRVDKVLLALPSLSRSDRKQILNDLERFAVKVQTIPGIKDVIEGNAEQDEIRDVEVEDLLGRDPVSPQAELMMSNIYNKVVMVTGAGGSIGSELCRQIIRQKPTKIILFELSEYALYAIDKELQDMVHEHQLSVEVIPLLGSVQRINRLENVMTAFSVETIYHAAAYKHVPLVENNIVEGVRNNVFGTMYTAQAAINAKVPTFVLVSTDKAVRPTNVMGATKRMAELVLQALAKQQSTTRFTMVRFGNVLGSSGSVVPLFRKQIKEGGPVTLTHNDITRYFMTIPEAAQLVIQAGAMGKGGDVFVLDMGEPVRIRDLAVKLVRLSGLEIKDEHNPHGDIEIHTTGLRPGEKLYEELLIGDNVQKTHHERIMTATEVMLPWQELEHILSKIDIACHAFNHEAILEILLEAPTAFAPSSEIVDLLFLANKELKVKERAAQKIVSLPGKKLSFTKPFS
jgi:FlaA1/EpsC-like NDP-sugar epimerase